MNSVLGNTEEILDRYVGGFHQYILKPQLSLIFVSRNLCDMVGYTKEELLTGTEDRYADLVYADDREIYDAFLRDLAAEEQSLSVQYRVVKKDGSILYVDDKATSFRGEDGIFVASSVLTDITPFKNENRRIDFLQDTFPFGFIRYTCETNPRVTFFNDRMLELLRFPEIKNGEMDYLEMYRSNVYLMIPMEERPRFAQFLKRVCTRETPISGEITVMRCDGTKARLYGWVAKCVNDQGEEEFQSVCMDVTERYRAMKAKETDRYLKALTEVYDKIFEYDFSNNTLKCLYGQNSEVFRWLRDIPMQMEDATEKWIQSSVWEKDRGEVARFFQTIFRRKGCSGEQRPPQIRYRAVSSSGEVKTYAGIFLKIDGSVGLFCCRNAAEEQEADSLRSENDSLRCMNENMHELVMRFTDGIVGFEVADGHVRPLYASDNICEFFGYTKEEWLEMAEQSHSVKTFVSKCRVDYEKFMALLQKGEAEFDYLDVNSGKTRRIKAVCSHPLSEEDPSPQYVMLYHMGTDAGEQSGVSIRTFGYFDVFVDDKPIAFRNKKSKELFALLVDRRGGYVSSEEAISFLWEDEEVNSVTLSRYRKVALRLKNILEEYGIADIVESVDGKRRIVPEKVQCDLFDYLSQKEEYAQLFKGSYLTNYSWGETTLGELLNKYI